MWGAMRQGVLDESMDRCRNRIIGHSEFWSKVVSERLRSGAILKGTGRGG
jgi:hypothetical protein